MARMVNWDPTDKIKEIRNAGMDRLESAAGIIQKNAIMKLRSLIKETYREHGAYKKGQYAGKSWTARHYREMIHTIRVVRKRDESSRNIWIMAGNYNTWWALQMEYGRGEWKGAAKSFFRPALNGSVPEIKAALASGNVSDSEVK